MKNLLTIKCKRNQFSRLFLSQCKRMGCTAASLVQRGMGLKGELEALWEWVDHRKHGD